MRRARNDAALQYCEEKAAPPGSSHYYALLRTSPKERAFALALYALEAELRNIAETTAEVSLGFAKLGWWNEEFQRALAGEATHPVTLLLTREAEYSLGVPLAPIWTSVDRWLERGMFRTTAELKTHADTFRGTITAALHRPPGRSPSPGSEATGRSSTNLGAALELGRSVIDPFPALPNAWTRLPTDELSLAGIRREDLGEAVGEVLGANLTRRPLDPDLGAALYRFLKPWWELGESTFAEALEGQSASVPHPRSEQILARIAYAQIRDRLKTKPAAIQRWLAPGGAQPTPLRKLWIAWHS